MNRRVVPWPPEAVASTAEHAIRGYLRAEDAFHENVLTRIKRG